MTTPTPDDNGGPAFPTTPVSHGYSPEASGLGTGCSPGMSIRDWFAGQALCGLLSGETELTVEEIVDRSFDIADEVLKVRKNY